MKTLIAILATLIVAAGSLAVYASNEDAKLMASLESGEKELWCHIGKEPQKIDFAKIERQEEHGWKFTNGYAKSCEIRDAI